MTTAQTNHGFTIIEIIVVLIILGVLAAIALPSYFNYIERSRSAEGVVMLKAIINQMQVCMAAKGDIIGGPAACATDLFNSRSQFKTPHFDFLNVSDCQPPWCWWIIVGRNNFEYSGGTVTQKFTCGNFSLNGVGQPLFVVCNHWNDNTAHMMANGPYLGLYEPLQ
jgi:prepilin-type N-terminal cleavage/methylation domain-containing protein